MPICWSFSAVQRKSPTFSAARQPQDRRKAVTRQLYEKNYPVSARSLASDNFSLILRTPGRVCQHATVSQHATMRPHATLGTHFATIKKRLAHQPPSVPSRPADRRHRPQNIAYLSTLLAAIKKRSLPSFASKQRLARILRPLQHTSVKYRPAAASAGVP